MLGQLGWSVSRSDTAVALHLLPGAASGFNESARAAALIADQQRLLGDAGKKTAKETAAAIELRSRIRTRDGASLTASLAGATTGKR